MKECQMRRQGSGAIRKRATNVSVRSDLLAAAREAGVDLSATLERALMEELAEEKRKKWRQENRDAIAAYPNVRVTEAGHGAGVYEAVLSMLMNARG